MEEAQDFHHRDHCLCSAVLNLTNVVNLCPGNYIIYVKHLI